MKKLLTFLSLAFITAFSFADEVDTSVVHSLYKCEHKNLSSWKHATREVLEDQEAKIKAVFLCDKTYPVFVADFLYDPMSDETSSFFFSFYIKLSQANAGLPYSIVSDDKFVIHVKTEGTGLALDYDELGEPEAPWGVNSFLQEEKDCFNYPTGSVKLNEGYVEFYTDRFCERRSKVLPKIDDFVSQLIGWKLQYLIFQAGTDVNSQSLIFVDSQNFSRVFTFNIEGDLVFGGSELLYFEPASRKPKANECQSQSEELAEWKSNRLGIGIAQQKVFDLLTGKVSDLHNFRCFAVQ
jgi:hypothetical protein